MSGNKHYKKDLLRYLIERLPHEEARLEEQKEEVERIKSRIRDARESLKAVSAK